MCRIQDGHGKNRFKLFDYLPEHYWVQTEFKYGFGHLYLVDFNECSSLFGKILHDFVQCQRRNGRAVKPDKVVF